MRLTQIKLSAFKSFADATVIHVPGQRVGVVGPNGCGKSNVIDAVRWVLGEASARQLRGESMQDVIFSGSHTRKPLSRASVELVFDNSDFALQGAWGQYAEISVRRTLTRSGESAYFINGQQVRRRDITDLFLGTGVGVRGYAIIEQGMISRIIEAKPEELRGFIEEAAGVSKYKERRRETEGRLKDTRENLARLGDLRAELERQAQKLEIQAQTAARYREMQTQLSLAQNRLDFLLWQKSLKDMDTAAALHNEIQAALDQFSAEQIRLHEESYALQLKEYATQQDADAVSRQRLTVREEIGRLEEQIKHSRQLRARRESEELRVRTELEQIAQKQVQWQDKIQAAALLAEEKNLIAEQYRALCDADEGLPETARQMETGAQLLENAKNAAAALRQKLALLQQKLERNRQDEAKLAATLPQTLPEIPDENQAEMLRMTAESLQENAQNLWQQTQDCQVQQENLQAALARAQADEAEKEKAVLALNAEAAAVGALLPQDAAQTQGADMPVLWRQITPAPRWQKAVGAVLGARLNACAADLRPDAQGNYPAAAWINRTPAAPLQLPENALLRQIQAAAAFQAALAYWLDGALCAESLDEALRRQDTLRHREFFVTPEGHCVDAAGVVLYAPQDTAQTALAQQRVRLAEIETALAETTPQFEAAAALSGSLKSRLAEVADALAHNRAEERAAQNRFREAEAALLKLTAERERLQEMHARAAGESARIAAERESLAQENALLQEESETVRQEMYAREETVMQAEEERDRLKILWERAQNDVLARERQAHQAELAAAEARQQLAQYRSEAESLAARAEELTLRQSEWTYENDGGEDEARHARLEELITQENAINQKFTAVQQQLKAHKSAAGILQKQEDDLRQKLPEAQQKQQNLLLAVQEAKLTAEKHQQNLQERGADMAALHEDAAHGIGAGQLGCDIGEIGRKLAQLGAVNLAALDELAQTRERQEYYRSQCEDVENAAAELEKAIAQIDQDSKNLFRQTFDEVNRHMQHYFPVLFGGGEAVLTLTEEDLLTTGIRIMARPPGKKNSTIHLLSGGEKALTAMSLVFALFSLNPAPFCLLDEVDAPLDDANTARFCDLVRDMSQNTQFLYISHNRLTMEMAEQLIGVTMQEKGVSRIVSVDIQAALQMAEQ